MFEYFNYIKLFTSAISPLNDRIFSGHKLIRGFIHVIVAACAEIITIFKIGIDVVVLLMHTFCFLQRPHYPRYIICCLNWFFSELYRHNCFSGYSTGKALHKEFHPKKPFTISQHYIRKGSKYVFVSFVPQLVTGWK